jgi:hypothetical protein
MEKLQMLQASALYDSVDSFLIQFDDWSDPRCFILIAGSKLSPFIFEQGLI